MLNSSRFIDERLSTSITSFNLVENPIDKNSPLSFQAWLEYNRNLYSNADDFLDRYQSYLNNWYEVKYCRKRCMGGS
jgi:TFIIF-interacting CTD phosphatase-like protein